MANGMVLAKTPLIKFNLTCKNGDYFDKTKKNHLSSKDLTLGARATICISIKFVQLKSGKSQFIHTL